MLAGVAMGQGFPGRWTRKYGSLREGVKEEEVFCHGWSKVKEAESGKQSHWGRLWGHNEPHGSL